MGISQFNTRKLARNEGLVEMILRKGMDGEE